VYLFGIAGQWSCHQPCVPSKQTGKIIVPSVPVSTASPASSRDEYRLADDVLGFDRRDWCNAVWW
jgi:hypothetical protein